MIMAMLLEEGIFNIGLSRVTMFRRNEFKGFLNFVSGFITEARFKDCDRNVIFVLVDTGLHLWLRHAYLKSTS